MQIAGLQKLTLLDYPSRIACTVFLKGCNLRCPYCHNAALVFISHDIALTRYISDNIAVMYLGRIVEYGPADEVIRNPQHPYTRALISNCASVDPFEVHEEIDIEGEPPTPINPGPGCYFAPRCYMATEECFKSYPERVDLGNGHYATCSKISCAECGKCNP